MIDFASCDDDLLVRKNTYASIFTDMETSLAGNLSVVEALSKAGAQTTGTELTLVFQPHLPTFRLPYGLQGGSWNLELFPKTSQASTDLVDSTNKGALERRDRDLDKSLGRFWTKRSSLIRNWTSDVAI